jgi:hypothetical protein
MKIYVFQFNDIYKIGLSDDPKKRLKSFPFMILVYEKNVTDPFYVEKKIHEHFKEYSIGGEFFRCSCGLTQEVSEIVDSIDKAPDNGEMVNFAGHDIQVLSDGFVNITRIIDKINEEMIKSGNRKKPILGNILKSVPIKSFIDDFESKYDYSPINSIVGRSFGTYVHPFLLNEIISLLDNGKYKIASYDYLFSYVKHKKGLDSQGALKK